MEGFVWQKHRIWIKYLKSADFSQVSRKHTMRLNCYQTISHSIAAVLLHLHLPNAADENWLLVKLPLFTVILTCCCQVPNWASVFLCEVKTHSHTLERSHCFAVGLNGSLHCGCVLNETEDVVYSTTETAETKPKEEPLLEKWGLCAWKKKSDHCCKICTKFLQGPAK